MDWDDARFFLAAARAGQLSAAARRLGVDHATVGRRISALEAALGARLLERRPTGCTPTRAGERFLEVAERMESEWLRAQGEFAEGQIEMTGAVRIGAPDGFGTLFLAPRLGKLAERHPGLTLQLAPLPRAFSLSRREADIAVTLERPQEGRLTARKLVDYTLGFYAAPAYLEQAGTPRTLDDLARHRLVTYVHDLVFTPELVFAPEIYGPNFRRFECASALAQGEAVRAGAGIGVLHDYVAAQDRGLVRVLAQLSYERSYWLVTHADAHDLMRVRAVADFIVAQVSAQRAVFRRARAASSAAMLAPGPGEP
jgi:DNA-binding transcriptional LysR family regulator